MKRIFGSFSRARLNRLRCNLRNSRQAWQTRLAYQLLWIVLILEQVLRQSRQVLWQQGIPSGRQIGDAAEEPGDYPFGLNPAGYTSRSMIVICK